MIGSFILVDLLIKELKERGRFMWEDSSLLYWWPKIQDLEIPKPKTWIVKISREELLDFIGNVDVLASYLVAMRSLIKEAGSPFFIRTDHLSGKHNWKDTCFVESIDKLIPNLRRLVLESESAQGMGMPINAIVIREYIEMDSRFKAFEGELPISPERRYFIRDGKVESHSPYWFEEAIRNPKDVNWRLKLAEMNYRSRLEQEVLDEYIKMVASVMGGYWSVDFCKAKNGNWYLIDMGAGERSWNPERSKDVEGMVST